jgi:CRP-like cAMP-binding protein
MLSMGTGRVVLRQGAWGREVFVVLNGEVQVERDGAPVARLGAGAVVGELALLHNAPRNATIRTTTETAVLVLTRRELATVMARCPTFAARMTTEADSRMLDVAA